MSHKSKEFPMHEFKVGDRVRIVNVGEDEGLLSPPHKIYASFLGLTGTVSETYGEFVEVDLDDHPRKPLRPFPECFSWRLKHLHSEETTCEVENRFIQIAEEMNE